MRNRPVGPRKTGKTTFFRILPPSVKGYAAAKKARPTGCAPITANPPDLQRRSAKKIGLKAVNKIQPRAGCGVPKGAQPAPLSICGYVLTQLKQPRLGASEAELRQIKKGRKPPTDKTANKVGKSPILLGEAFIFIEIPFLFCPVGAPLRWLLREVVLTALKHNRVSTRGLVAPPLEPRNQPEAGFY